MIAAMTQLSASSDRAHAERGAVSVGVTVSRAEWAAEITPKVSTMQPMALQFGLNLAIQETV